eukprot:2153126-Pyramimonas_sp.AAC.1
MMTRTRTTTDDDDDDGGDDVDGRRPMTTTTTPAETFRLHHDVNVADCRNSSRMSIPREIPQADNDVRFARGVVVPWLRIVRVNHARVVGAREHVQLVVEPQRQLHAHQSESTVLASEGEGGGRARDAGLLRRREEEGGG